MALTLAINAPQINKPCHFSVIDESFEYLASLLANAPSDCTVRVKGIYEVKHPIHLSSQLIAEDTSYDPADEPASYALAQGQHGGAYPLVHTTAIFRHAPEYSGPLLIINRTGRATNVGLLPDGHSYEKRGCYETAVEFENKQSSRSLLAYPVNMIGQLCSSESKTRKTPTDNERSSKSSSPPPDKQESTYSHGEGATGASSTTGVSTSGSGDERDDDNDQRRRKYTQSEWHKGTTYAELIEESLRNGDKSVQEIYEDIIAYARGQGHELGNQRCNESWKNSVRHCLSLQKHFVRREQESGARGAKWHFDPSQKKQTPAKRIKITVVNGLWAEVHNPQILNGHPTLLVDFPGGQQPGATATVSSEISDFSSFLPACSPMSPAFDLKFLDEGPSALEESEFNPSFNESQP